MTAVETEPRLTRAEVSARRRKAAMIRRMALARTPAGKLSVAYDYFRSIASNSVQADRATESVVLCLLDQAENINPLTKVTR